MSRPLRTSERIKQRQRSLQRQVRLEVSILLAIIIMAWLADFILLKSDLIITKSLTIGAALNCVSQLAYIYFALKYTKPQAGRMLVNQFYIGQLVKWLIVLIGFSAIFISMKQLSSLAVILGFIFMQIGHIISIWKQK